MSINVQINKETNWKERSSTKSCAHCGFLKIISFDMIVKYVCTQKKVVTLLNVISLHFELRNIDSKYQNKSSNSKNRVESCI